MYPAEAENEVKHISGKCDLLGYRHIFPSNLTNSQFRSVSGSGPGFKGIPTHKGRVCVS